MTWQSLPIRSIEELSFNAWPALQSMYYDGWLLRFANEYTRRSNSVNPTYPSVIDPIEKIAYCEQIYRKRKQDVVFKITPACYPPNLDAVLANCGYVQEATTSVRTLTLEDLEQPTVETVTCLNEPTSAWLDGFCTLNTLHNHRSTMEQILKAIVPERCFIALYQQNEIVAVGLAVHDGEYVGLFDIVTAAHWRNRGFGKQVLLHLLNWAKENGAQHAYLQVMTNNQPALSLYSKVGFQEIYQYWYRVKR
jgi:N-acetylglutamate synthase